MTLTPIDQVVVDMVSRLDENLSELWQERAAVRQYDGAQSRELAEAMALIDVIQMHTHEAMSCWLRRTDHLM